MATVKRALISVSDKGGIVDFAKELAGLGIELISTGGTYRLLKENGLSVKEVSEVTGFPEMLDGRVKTLHPKVHAGILARRDVPEHMKAIADKGIDTIDMVVINLYPSKQTVLKEGATLDEIVENIDIGGPSMIRAAAKNYKSVAVVTSPDQYPPILEQLKSKGELDEALLSKLMSEAFITTANYDAMIASQMNARFGTMFPKSFPMPSELVQELRYGENPDQKAAFYLDPFTPGNTVAKMEKVHGKELSYNNILDMDKALDICMDFEKPTAVVMKHTNPCGLASADTIFEAFETAYNVDPLSAFGCVICLNRNCDMKTAEMISKYFVEVVIAPDFDKGVLELLEQKKNIRLMRTNAPIGPKYRVREMKVKRTQGGYLVQTDENITVTRDNLKVITKRAPTDEEIDAMLFAWKLAKHVTSNWPTQGCVMASDAFFPFRDGVDEAAKAGVTAIIQPGGSIRDEEVIQAANEYGMAMVFTGCRVFRHG